MFQGVISLVDPLGLAPAHWHVYFDLILSPYTRERAYCSEARDLCISMDINNASDGVLEKS